LQGHTARALLEADPDPDSEAKSLSSYLRNLSKEARQRDSLPPLYCVHRPENLVLQGGGPKGIAYVGALQELERNGQMDELRRCAGTSAGAITAALLACNFSAAEVEALLRQTDLSSFLDHPLKKERLKERLLDKPLMNLWRVFKACVNPVGTTAQALQVLWRTTGVCDGEVFRQWIEEQIASKTGIQYCTFGELAELRERGKPFKELHVFATDLSTQKPVRLSACARGGSLKDVVISDAVRASMSIPAAFKPHCLHIKTRAGDSVDRKAAPHLGQFVDGGMLYNYPLNAFDKRKYLSSFSGDTASGEAFLINKRTLGLSLFTPEQPMERTARAMASARVETVGDLVRTIASYYYSAEVVLSEEIFGDANQQRDVQVMSFVWCFDRPFAAVGES
jgi:predicted acylesterase/phospholipase RssA